VRTAKQDPEKFCAYCGAKMLRSRFNGRLEDLTRFLQRRYCSLSCSHQGRVVADPTLAALRKRAVKFRTTSCENCGATLGISAHHANGDVSVNTAGHIQTLCASCHMKLHHRQWKRGEKPRRLYQGEAYPIDHTALRRSATRSCRSRPTRSSKRSRKP
jgi:hypothetical protein